ncbi:hypothetical protein LMG28140_03748 [Paraburkholderia metrosideri]|uniref:Uncharacterized protein n=1 Tax=Paraburkholderia metrosideri TaxID=580937 RepID=A0ABM8NT72_9BURK|nr:hypothetical protein LMG28140_03748 [Paraburkholderia metrosideri]
MRGSRLTAGEPSREQRLCPPPGEFWVMSGSTPNAPRALRKWSRIVACYVPALRGGCFIFAAIISQQKTSPEHVKNTAL